MSLPITSANGQNEENTMKSKLIIATLLSLIAVGAIAQASKAYFSGRVAAGSTKYHTYTLSRGTWDFEALGDSEDGDIDMYVYDESGRLIDSDDMDDNDPMCSITNPYRQKFTVKIVNAGDYSEHYSGTIE